MRNRYIFVSLKKYDIAAALKVTKWARTGTACSQRNYFVQYLSNVVFGQETIRFELLVGYHRSWSFDYHLTSKPV
jgi:hypothetical protein